MQEVYTLPDTNIAPWKMVVGSWGDYLPFGKPYFLGLLLPVLEGFCALDWGLVGFFSNSIYHLFSGLLGEATMSITFRHSVLSRMTYSGVHLFKVPNSQSVTWSSTTSTSIIHQHHHSSLIIIHAGIRELSLGYKLLIFSITPHIAGTCDY